LKADEADNSDAIKLSIYWSDQGPKYNSHVSNTGSWLSSRIPTCTNRITLSKQLLPESFPYWLPRIPRWLGGWVPQRITQQSTEKIKDIPAKLGPLRRHRDYDLIDGYWGTCATLKCWI